MAYGFGGAERTTANLLSDLDRRRIRQITLVAPAALKPWLPDTDHTFIDAEPLGLQGGFTTPGDLYRQTRIVVKLLRNHTPDLALGMMHYAAALVVLGRRWAGASTRTIASYRGPYRQYLRHYEPGFRRQWFLRTAIAATTLLADHLIVPSQGTADELRGRFLNPAARTTVIPNGIDGAVVARLAEAPAPELADRAGVATPILCAIARLAPEKQLGLLLDAFRQVRATRPAELIILGDGPERTPLETQIAAWGLTESVRLLGHRDNIYPYLRGADLFIHTCRFEGFGYAVLEALACGTAVIATDCPYGPREILGDSEYGILVPPDDPAALAEAMHRLLADPAQRQAQAIHGRQRAEQLSIDRMVRAYETVFIDLAQRGRTTFP